MTAGTIGPHCLLVHIGMAGNTFRTRAFKNQGLVTGPAIGDSMPSF